MTPPYVPLETIQLLSETSFSKIKNKKVIWGGTLKWDALYKFPLIIITRNKTIACESKIPIYKVNVIKRITRIFLLGINKNNVNT